MFSKIIRAPPHIKDVFERLHSILKCGHSERQHHQSPFWKTANVSATLPAIVHQKTRGLQLLREPYHSAIHLG